MNASVLFLAIGRLVLQIGLVGEENSLAERKLWIQTRPGEG